MDFLKNLLRHARVRSAVPQCPRDQEITGVFAGELFAEHRQACLFSKKSVMYPVDSLFDVVLTTNSGYPLDQNLYQAVKGMSAAAKVIKPGGTIVCAARMSRRPAEPRLVRRGAGGAPDAGCAARDDQRVGLLTPRRMA